MSLYTTHDPDSVNDWAGRPERALRQTRTNLRMLTTLCLIVVATSACRESGPTGESALIQEGVAVSPANAQVAVGGTLQLSAQLFDDNGDPVQNQAFTWWTPDASIATVDPSGVVSGVGPGTVTIAAITADQSSTGFADIAVVNQSGEGGGGSGGGGGASGSSGANILDVPANNSAAGPMEPAGMTPIGLSHFDDFGLFTGVDPSSRARHELPEGGVHFYGGGVEAGTPGSRVSHTSRGWLQILMPKACMGHAGSSCGTMLTHAAAKSAAEPNTPGYFREMYYRFSIRVDSNYWVNPSGNKVATQMWRNSQNGKTNGLGWIMVFARTPQRWPGQQIQNAPTPPTFGWAYGSGACGYPRNHRGTVEARPNTDHVIELWLKMASGPCATDGALRLWVDGQLSVSLDNIPTWDPALGSSIAGGDQLWGLKIQNLLGGTCDQSDWVENGGPGCPSADLNIEHDYLYMSAR